MHAASTGLILVHDICEAHFSWSCGAEENADWEYVGGWVAGRGWVKGGGVGKDKDSEVLVFMNNQKWDFTVFGCPPLHCQY